jgi:mono/diheme cytochrome c family protein
MTMKKLLLPIFFVGFILPAMALADVKADYQANCTKCHGGSAKTNARRALLLKVSPQKLYLPASEMTREEMIATIEKGKNQMPAFEDKLSKDQIAAIADLVKSAKKK